MIKQKRYSCIFIFLMLCYLPEVIGQNLIAPPLTRDLFRLTKSASLSKKASSVRIENDTAYFDFLIGLPKEYLSTEWCVILSPTLMPDKDSTIILPEVIVKGSKFAEKQETDYKNYEEYINSIVDRSAYDSVFLDKKSIEQDVMFRQNLYWDVIYKEWEKQIEFEKWKSEQDGALKYFIPDQINYSEKLKVQYENRISAQSAQYLKLGIDTTGLYNRYMNEYQKQNAKLPRFKVKNDIPEKAIPKKYKAIYKSGRSLDDITERIMSLIASSDSIILSYRLEDMIDNEKKMLRKDSIFYDLVDFPRNKNAKLDSIVSVDSDFTYLYNYMCPINKDTESFKITLTGRILAIDRSSYALPKCDTLLYILPMSIRRKEN